MLLLKRAQSTDQGDELGLPVGIGLGKDGLELGSCGRDGHAQAFGGELDGFAGTDVGRKLCLRAAEAEGLGKQSRIRDILCMQIK